MGFVGNDFTRAFGLDVPIVQGPAGGVTGPELVAAVAEAGALGVLPIWITSPAGAARLIEATRRLTARAFAVNLRADLVQSDHVAAAVDAGVSDFHLFWGDPAPSMPRIRAAGGRTICTIGDVEAARVALDAGADALVAQGVEAGGHVLGEVPLRELLEAVLPLAGRIPVIAAGGLMDAGDVAAMLALGASAALLGTRFVATRESLAHDAYKQALMDAGKDATVRSCCFDGGWPDAPHRNLKNSTFAAWDRAGRPAPGARPGEGEVVLRLGTVAIERYAATPPRRDMSGDAEAAVMYAGTGVARLADCPDTADLVRSLTTLL